jgi:hypothetical protein
VLALIALSAILALALWAFGPRTSQCPNPKFAHRAQSPNANFGFKKGARTIELLVPFDSEVRMRVCRKHLRTSESGHWARVVPTVMPRCRERPSSYDQCIRGSPVVVMLLSNCR